MSVSPKIPFYYINYPVIVFGKEFVIYNVPVKVETPKELNYVNACRLEDGSKLIGL